MSGFCGSGKGFGVSIGHAGELLQGALWHNAKLEPFLVTLPAPPFSSRATVRALAATADEVHPPWKTKALEAARLAWSNLDGGPASLFLSIESETPVGRGCGSSTSDCVAAIRAVANLLNRSLSPQEIARWSATAESAADSTMFDMQPVAFRQQSGQLLRSLGDSFPPMRIVAVDLGGPAIDTVARTRPHYSVCEIGNFERLLLSLEQSIQRQDALGVAQVASVSAAIQQRYYPHPRWNEFVVVVKAAGALGVACAHSGSLGVALLDHAAGNVEHRIAEALGQLDLPVLARYALEESLCPSS